MAEILGRRLVKVLGPPLSVVHSRGEGVDAGEKEPPLHGGLGGGGGRGQGLDAGQHRRLLLVASDVRLQMLLLIEG